MIAEKITDLIGNTPLLKIPAHVHGLHNIDLYAKLEMMNPFGSVKDRVAWAMLKDDIEELKATNKPIYERSSGNTAKALQAIANLYGVDVKLVTNLAKVDVVKDIVRMMGADIHEISGASECYDPNDPNDPRHIIDRMIKESENDGFFTAQFDNPKNPDIHYQTTGKEIIDDLGSIDYFFGGLGTSGSTLGVSRRIRDDINPDLKTIGICATKKDYIPGIRPFEEMWEAGVFVKDNYNDFVFVDSGESCDAMMELVKKCGVLCGPTSGASYLGTLKYLREIDPTLTTRKKAVFIVCDRMEWYTEYVRERRPDFFQQPIKEGSIKLFSSPTANDDYIVPAETASQWIDEKKPLIIDVRGNLAYKMMTIPGAINIPIELFEKMVDGQSPFPKDQSLLLICPVGEKTIHYAAYLQSRGYNAFSLEGGIMNWRNNGHELKKVV